MIDIFGRLLVPSGIIVILIALALLEVIAFRNRRIARIFCIAAIAVYALFGSGPVAYALLGPLERMHPPLTRPDQLGEIDTIVILTGYAAPLDSVSPASWLNESSAYRILEAMWLKQHFPGARVLISGTAESARAMRDVLLSLGVPIAEVSADAPAQDTAMSATRLRRSISEEQRCALVTSAGHMPRAILSLAKEGIKCAPVPTEMYTPFRLGAIEYLPSPQMLKLSDHAIHEYLGILWHRLRGNL